MRVIPAVIYRFLTAWFQDDANMKYSEYLIQ